MFFEIFEYTGKKTIGSKHLCGGDIQKLDISFACNGGDKSGSWACSLLDECTFGTRIVRILDSDWHIMLQCRLHGNGMKNLCTKVGKFTGLFVAHILHRNGIFYQSWICTENSIHILPNLNFIEFTSCSNGCCCEIASTPSKGGNLTIWVVTNETGHDSNYIGIDFIFKCIADGRFGGWQKLCISKGTVCEDTYLPCIKGLGGHANLI
mmetsp:Transcript_19447/g.27361  ORF Transcript_19447/g.27361 Transcript_19447/m.27361 type:complete len:208 (+) Transcript_19447:1115-1738(+)